MKSCVGLLKRKDLLIYWNIQNGYQADCSTVSSTSESYKSFGSHTVGSTYWSPFTVCEYTASLTVSMNESQVSFSSLV